MATRSRNPLRVRLRQIGLLAVMPLPQSIKRLLYRWCFGYRIGRRARIGAAYLDCAALTVADSARIGHGVVFWRCGEVQIGSKAVIGPLNLFRGGDRIQIDDYAQVLRLNVINAIPDHDCFNDPDSSFHLGYGAVVTAEHRIDFTDRVSIGRCSVLGGRNSSIWTHTIRTGKPVEIGSHCYLASEIRIAPGVRVPDSSIVGLGSVLTHSIPEGGFLIAGVPARKRRPLSAEDEALIFRATRADLPEQVFPALPPHRAALPRRLRPGLARPAGGAPRAILVQNDRVT